MLIASRYLCLLFCIISIDLYAQSSANPWKLLSDVEIKDRYDEAEGYEVSYPVFGGKAKSLDGKTITVEGYMIPYEVYLGPKYFILSSLPIAACFFCGGAGPETVMEVFTQESVELTNETIKVRGRLELNPDDPDRMMYILKDAELVD
ncbi:hypothetical protein OKW21_004859 [Catalinimonas alkaloidigena]|uniref:hypothetical protein n=1 Tax=Catalinimonas alkaloidigena TaxID=1075417 RepID=UPI002405C427|nr:hypothetical protein [Catalinimonas alkaloidigena]MDF9799596.1 hypothetical protein [Catalinimonas alkaloidigena]